MKRIFTITALIALFATGAYAQNRPQLGVKAGFNFAKETVDEGSTNARTAVYAGVFAEWWVSRVTDFQAELLYSMQGGEYPYNGMNCVEKLDYLVVPLMFKFHVNQKRSFSIDAGMHLGYLVSAKVTSGSSTSDVYNNSNMNKGDASVAVGVSWKIDGRFDVGARFLGGATKIATTSAHRNAVFQLGGAYRF